MVASKSPDVFGCLSHEVYGSSVYHFSTPPSIQPSVLFAFCNGFKLLPAYLENKPKNVCH